MSGLMSRIRSRRADGQPTTAASPEGDAPAEQPTVVVPDAAAETAPDGAHTAEADGAAATEVAPAVEEPVPAPAADEPAVSPDEVAATTEPETIDVPAGAEATPSGPSFRDRGKLRRRLRYLRRVRELGFRDLGGLIFDLDRFGRERPDLVQAKLAALGGIDSELRTLEAALDDERPIEELEEPGVAACAHCGTIHGSDANFCPSCGRPAGTRPEPPEAPAPDPPE